MLGGKRRKLLEFAWINLGLLLVAAGIHFFKSPNGFATGGVSGIAIIVSRYVPSIPVGPMMLIVNMLLLVIGFLAIGSNFGSNTVYSSFALSGFVWLFDLVRPMAAPMTDDRMLELAFSILLPAIGSALVFNMNASTGGTDIIAKVLSLKTSLDIGKALLAADFLIAAGACVAFGMKIGLYSMLGLFLKGFVIDMAIESLNLKKLLTIITTHSDEVCGYITQTLHRGATVHDARGAWTLEPKQVITAVMNRRQAVQLRGYIREIDPKAFIAITNSSEIIGKGFRSN